MTKRKKIAIGIGVFLLHIGALLLLGYSISEVIANHMPF